MTPPVAIVHDYLTQRGGAERVVLAMSRVFPDAPVFTSLYDPTGTYPEFADVDVRPSALNRVPLFRRSHRLALPVLAPTFSRMNIDADVVICSSSGWAHGAHTAGRKLVYCYTPARWLYQSDRYLGEKGGAGRLALAGLRPVLRRWDDKAARSADRYVAISSVVADRIRATYHRDADVIFPPHAVADGPSAPVPDLLPGFYLCVARLLPYKNALEIVEAFDRIAPRRLVVVGTGPQDGAIRERAGASVKVLGSVNDAQLRWLYDSCTAVIAASYEDYGLTPLEGASFGKPAVVLRWGGFLDTVAEGETGVFFDSPTPEAIADAVRVSETRQWDAAAIRDHAEAFSERRFAQQLRRVTEQVRAGSDEG